MWFVTAGTENCTPVSIDTGEIGFVFTVKGCNIQLGRHRRFKALLHDQILFQKLFQLQTNQQMDVESWSVSRFCYVFCCVKLWSEFGIAWYKLSKYICANSNIKSDGVLSPNHILTSRSQLVRVGSSCLSNCGISPWIIVKEWDSK